MTPTPKVTTYNRTKLPTCGEFTHVESLCSSFVSSSKHGVKRDMGASALGLVLSQLHVTPGKGHERRRRPSCPHSHLSQPTSWPQTHTDLIQILNKKRRPGESSQNYHPTESRARLRTWWPLRADAGAANLSHCRLQLFLLTDCSSLYLADVFTSVTVKTRTLSAPAPQLPPHNSALLSDSSSCGIITQRAHPEGQKAWTWNPNSLHETSRVDPESVLYTYDLILQIKWF